VARACARRRRPEHDDHRTGDGHDRPDDVAARRPFTEQPVDHHQQRHGLQRTDHRCVHDARALQRAEERRDVEREEHIARRADLDRLRGDGAPHA
jgi:hypothetical protein